MTEADWELGTWKGSRRQQHLDYLALPWRRKLELLEGLCDFGRRTLESRRRRGLPYIDPYTGELVPGRAVLDEEPSARVAEEPPERSAGER